MDEEEARLGLPSGASLRPANTMKSDNNFIASPRSVKHLGCASRARPEPQAKNHKRFPCLTNPPRRSYNRARVIAYAALSPHCQSLQPQALGAGALPVGVGGGGARAAAA